MRSLRSACEYPIATRGRVEHYIWPDIGKESSRGLPLFYPAAWAAVFLLVGHGTLNAQSDSVTGDTNVPVFWGLTIASALIIGSLGSMIVAARRQAKLERLARVTAERALEGQPEATSSMVDPIDDSDQMDIPTVPEPLIQACGNGTCVLYAGSGFSAQAGLPTWSQALEQFVGQMRETEGPERWGARQTAGVG